MMSPWFFSVSQVNFDLSGGLYTSDCKKISFVNRPKNSHLSSNKLD